MATKNTLDTNLAITVFYNLQNASFMHISSPDNAIEDVYGTLGHFVKIKVASKMVDSRFIMEMPYFFQICIIFFAFLKARLSFVSKMFDLSTNLSLVNSLIRTSGVQDGEIKLNWALKRINNNKISNKISFIMYY